MKRFVIASACLGIVAFLSLQQWQSTSPGRSKESDAHRGLIIHNESSNESSGFGEPIRTKSRIRIHHPQPSIEETENLIRTTIIPVLVLPPDQPLPERIARINELIQMTGVEPYRLRLILRSADPANQWRMRDELRVREIPLGSALKYLCDATKLRCRVRENGIVELSTIQDQESMADLPDPSKKAVNTPPVEIDVFGNDASASELPDPFVDSAPPH